MKKIYVLLLTLFSTPAIAKTTTTTVFQCHTTNKKIVSVIMDQNKVYYRFGKINAAPELSFVTPKDKTSTFQWQGWGSSILYNVNIPRGNITYTVFSSVDRMTEEHKSESGIIVRKNDKEIARILCQENNKFYINNMEDIDLPLEK